MTNYCKTCPVSTGTHKPAEAVHQIAEPQTKQTEALRLADWLNQGGWPSYVPQEAAAELLRLHAENEALKKQMAAAQQAVQAAEGVPTTIDPNQCSQDVFNNGVSVGLFDIPKDTANAICVGISEATGVRLDWHYIAGRVHMKALAATQPAPQAVQPAIMPKGESAAAQLRAMATNYPAGHSWDKLDARACIRGALEIEALRALLAAAPAHPAEGVPTSSDLRERLARLEAGCNAHTTPTVYEAIADSKAALDELDEARQRVGISLAATQPAVPQEDAIAEIVSASHDAAEFGERGINFLRDFQHLEYGTKLYAHPAAPQAVQAAVPATNHSETPNSSTIIVPYGWKLVPDDATPEWVTNLEALPDWREAVGECIKRFLAAAPAHPAEGVPAMAAPFAEVLTDEDMEDFVSTHGFTGDFESMARIVEEKVLEKVAATQPTAQGMEADLADEQIDETFNQMPDGAAGFLKSWGYRQFARAVLAAQAKQGGAA